jgi:integrase
MTTDGITPIPLADFRRKILALYEPPMRSAATHKKMRQVLDVLETLEGVYTTADLTTGMVGRFIASRPAAEHPNTTHGLVGYLRSACNQAAAEGWVRVSPFMVRKRWCRKVAPQGKRHHSREDIAKVLDLMSLDSQRKPGWAGWRAARVHAVTSLVAYTGLRKMEALTLWAGDVDLAGGFIRVVARQRLKTEGSEQPVPIPDALAPTLAAWLPRAAADVDKPWLFPNALGTGPWLGGSPAYRPLERLRRYGVRCGVTGFSFLSLRHSFATHAEYWGLSGLMVARILRHTNERTQLGYRHADLANLREVTRGISFEGPAS